MSINKPKTSVADHCIKWSQKTIL